MDTGKIYYDIDGNECSIMQMVKKEPWWAANRIQEGEKAIEMVKALEKAISIYSREQLDKEFENDKEAIKSFIEDWGDE